MENKTKTNLKNYLKKMRTIVEVSSDSQIQTLFEPAIQAVSNLTDLYQKEDKVMEEISQISSEVLIRLKSLNDYSSFLNSASLDGYLKKIIKFFECYYNPSYIYIFDILVSNLYTPQSIEIFTHFFESLTSIVMKMVKPESWVGDKIMIDQVSYDVSEHFDFLRSNGGLMIDDILDDYFGLVLAYEQVNPSILLSSSHFNLICRQLLNTYNVKFIYSVNTTPKCLISVLKIMESLNYEMQSFWIKYWEYIAEQSILFIFQELLLEEKTHCVLEIILRINHLFGEQIGPLIAKTINSISRSVITERECNTFLQLLNVKDRAEIMKKSLFNLIRPIRKRIDPKGVSRN